MRCVVSVSVLQLPFDVPLKQASKLGYQLWFVLMSYRGRTVCAGVAEDMTTFYSGAKGPTAGQPWSKS